MSIFYSIHYIFWLISSIIFFGVGEFLSKKFALNPKWFYVVGVVMAYSIGTLFWLPAILQKNHLSVVGAMWSILSLVTTVFIGILIFGEKLNTLGIIGIILGFSSIIILSLA
jgi:multidrug transporter EmrE-like cation transporter